MSRIFANQPYARYVPKQKKTEQSLQLQICQFLRLQYPSVIFRSDYASGVHLTMSQAVTNKRLQSSRSWPDMQIVTSQRGYHGMFLEIKPENTTIYLKIGANKGELTTNPHIREQAAMLKELNRLGYFARFGVGFDNSVKLIRWYMGDTELDNTELF